MRLERSENEPERMRSIDTKGNTMYKADNAREEGRGESELTASEARPFPPFPHGRGKRPTTAEAVVSVAARLKEVEAELKALRDLEADDGEAF